MLPIKELESYLKTGKYSELFIKEYAYYINNGIYEPDFIGREIEYLEGKSPNTTTKKESIFKGILLKGLWHKHFFDAQHIPTNCLNMLEKNEKKILNKNLTDKEFLNSILNLVHKSVVSHDKTGDWIVYKKTDSGNFYLTIAKHNEPDEQIYNRIKPYLTNIENKV